MSAAQRESQLPIYIKPSSSYFFLEIVNESREFVLQAKSHFDLMEWYQAILAQIESLRMNKAIQRNSEAIRAKSLELAIADQKIVHKLTKFSANFQPDILPQLLDFVNDAFIMELLPNLTRYMFFAE